MATALAPQLWPLRRIHRLPLVSTPPPLRRLSAVRCNSSGLLNIRTPPKKVTDVAVENFEVEVTNPRFPAAASFIGFVMAAVPTLHAMGRTAIAVAKLADIAREELPSTMAAIRLSGMEISDLTLELSDLSQEISDGVNKSAQAVQAAEAGVRKIGSLARQKTISMIDERASLPVISIQPVVAGVAKKTSAAVGHAGKTFMNIISGGNPLSLGDERIDI
ncbi:hypothetical protein E3N88_17785 [Mikania micrantha]|uniref:Uncharacterized protein n=1 Tax=Mikania micrantha TaxID=192012 RepID=A0A5N6NU72_9ASTR|nr:hypothetical protein E3N88_17785 [Mikania micrantha]